MLALACDFRIAAAGEYNIGVDEVRNNVPFPRVTMEIVKAALPPQQQREALLLGKYWTPATAFEARVVDQVAPTPEAAVAAACGLVCSLPAQAAFAYSVNKAYLHRPFLADMVGESYDQFVNACYTPEAQARFEAARQRMGRKRGTQRGTSGAAAGAAASGTQPAPPRSTWAVPRRTVLLRRGGVVYEVLRECHVGIVTQTLIDVWVGQNVIMNALGVTKDEFRPLASKRARDAALVGLSLVATDEASGQCVGFFLWEDMAASAWGEKLAISPKFEAQFRFMTELEGEYLKHRGVTSLPRGEVLHGIYGGTAKERSGSGVVTALMNLSELWARRCGFSRMVTEAVVIGSQYVSFKLGWVDIALKQYTNFVHRGAKPFVDVPVHARSPCAVLFELNLCDKPPVEVAGASVPTASAPLQGRAVRPVSKL